MNYATFSQLLELQLLLLPVDHVPNGGGARCRLAVPQHALDGAQAGGRALGGTPQHRKGGTDLYRIPQGGACPVHLQHIQGSIAQPRVLKGLPDDLSQAPRIKN